MPFVFYIYRFPPDPHNKGWGGNGGAEAVGGQVLADLIPVNNERESEKVTQKVFWCGGWVGGG